MHEYCKNKKRRSLLARNLGNGEYVHCGSLKGGGGSHEVRRIISLECF